MRTNDDEYYVQGIDDRRSNVSRFCLRQSSFTPVVRVFGCCVSECFFDGRSPSDEKNRKVPRIDSFVTIVKADELVEACPVLCQGTACQSTRVNFERKPHQRKHRRQVATNHQPCLAFPYRRGPFRSIGFRNHGNCCLDSGFRCGGGLAWRSFYVFPAI